MAQPGDPYPIRAVLDHFHSVGLFDRDGGASLKVYSLPFRQLVDLGVFIAQAGLGGKHVTAQGSPFHCASVSLSGGPYPCLEAECRLKSARELARYAIMFSDRVYTYNPFSQFLPAPDGTVDVQDSVNVRMEFEIGLRLLQEWAPVIEAGIIFPFPHGDHTCHWCLAKDSFGSDASRRLDRAVAIYKR